MLVGTYQGCRSFLSSLYISSNITSYFLQGVPTDQLYQLCCVNTYTYWPAVCSTSEDRHLNCIALLMFTCIGPAAYSALGDRHHNGITCHNPHVCWPSYVRLWTSWDRGRTTMLPIVRWFERKVNSL